jgi:hypothetical protein
MKTLVLFIATALLLAGPWAMLAPRLPRFAGGLRERIGWAAAHFGSEVGALTLVEAAKLSENDLQRGVVETFILQTVVLDRLPLESIEGNAFAYNEEATLPGVEFRAVNSAYAESTGTFNQKTESLVILGGDADVDTFIQRTRGNLNDQRAVQTAMKVKAAVLKFQDTYINGDVAVDANSFDGLKKRLTGAQVIDPGGNGIPVVGADDAARHAFFDQVDALLAAVPGGADALYMNDIIRGKFRSAARRVGGWNMERDDFGRSIEFYNDVPLFDIGSKADGTRIIPQTEVEGADNATSSIYAVHYSESEAEAGVMGLFNGPSADQPIDVRDLGEIDSKPVLRTRIEAFLGLAVFGRGAARLKGVKNA